MAERARVLAEAALAEGARLGNAALLRSSAEMFALAACIGSDTNAIQLLRNLCTAMASSSAPPRWTQLHVIACSCYSAAVSKTPVHLLHCLLFLTDSKAVV